MHVVGSAYFWFFRSDLRGCRGWDRFAWQTFAAFNGIVGVVTMIAAVFLTIYSLWLYMVRYGRVVTG